MRRQQPIARQIIALVTAAVLATAGAMVAITLIGPPPRAAPVQMSDIVIALRGDEFDRPGLDRVRQEAAAQPPAPREGEQRDATAELWLAGELGADPSHIRAFVIGQGPPGGDDRARRPARMHGDGTFGWHHAGHWRIVHVDPAPVALHWWATVALVTVLVLGAIIGLAWRSAQAITRPLERLAGHVAGDGGDLHIDAIEGPPEIAVVAGALAGFQRAQIEQVAERTRMLSAIAHDLGTPLTRLAFRLEALPEAQRDAAQGDIAAMRRLIEDSLALDRSASEPAERFDLADLVAAMVDECRAMELPVAAGLISPAPVLASQRALGRLVQNLIDNALRYGEAATLQVACTGGEALLTVRDRGPGFSAEMLRDGCRPFVRGEASRNRATGGSGLGLAIAAAIARQHRGTLELRNGASGGEVLLRLPLAG